MIAMLNKSIYKMTEIFGPQLCTLKQQWEQG
jgi:hypothetical protein